MTAYAPTFPVSINTTPEDDGLYLGLSRQDLKSHQAICELIDNAISATPSDKFFTVELHVEKKGEEVSVTVADGGIGITLQDITESILRIGGQGTQKGRLNEHGFGLKNSLCMLTANKRDFVIVTRDAVAAAQNHTYVVKGPFSRDMVVVSGDDSDWQEGVLKCNSDTGTRVRAVTTFQYFRSLYQSANKFDSLIERLLEHLGVLYRGYLHDARNEMWIRWRDVTEGASEWHDERVMAVEIPFTKSNGEKIKFSYDGTNYIAHYKWGELDPAAIQDGSKGRPYPLKIYYQENQKTQGIDIVVRGRLILPHTLEYLWPDMMRHGELNKFAGELLIDDPAFSTVNNKTQLDPNNPIWERLLEILQSEDRYKPDRAVSSYQEKEIRKKLLARLPQIVSGSEAFEDFPTWPGLGVKIDLLHRFTKDHEEVYELKSGTARPRDVYQLVMYWDGRVEEGVRPQLGRVVAAQASQGAMQLIEYWNKRKDKGGHAYALEFKSIDELLG